MCQGGPSFLILISVPRRSLFPHFNQCAKEVPLSSFSISVPRRSLFPHFNQCAKEVPLFSFSIRVSMRSLFHHFLSVCQGGPSLLILYQCDAVKVRLMRQKTDHSVKPRVSTKYPKDLCIFCPIIERDHHTLPERNLNNLKNQRRQTTGIRPQENPEPEFLNV